MKKVAPCPTKLDQQGGTWYFQIQLWLTFSHSTWISNLFYSYFSNKFPPSIFLSMLPVFLIILKVIGVLSFTLHKQCGSREWCVVIFWLYLPLRGQNVGNPRVKILKEICEIFFEQIDKKSHNISSTFFKPFVCDICSKKCVIRYLQRYFSPAALFINIRYWISLH